MIDKIKRVKIESLARNKGVPIEDNDENDKYFEFHYKISVKSDDEYNFIKNFVKKYDARLSSNVPLKNASNIFTGAIIPKWDTTNFPGSYKIGDNIGTFLNTLSSNNICYGNYCLNGAYNSNPL